MSCRFGRIAAAVDDLALLRQVVLLVELIVGAVQIVDAGGNDHALGIHPRTLADAVARVHGAGALRRQIRVPGLAAGAGRCREVLAMLVGAGKPAEIGAFARHRRWSRRNSYWPAAPAPAPRRRTPDTPPAAQPSEWQSFGTSRHWQRPVAPPSGKHNTAASPLFRRSRSLDRRNRQPGLP